MVASTTGGECSVYGAGNLFGSAQKAVLTAHFSLDSPASLLEVTSYFHNTLLLKLHRVIKLNLLQNKRVHIIP